MMDVRAYALEFATLATAGPAGVAPGDATHELITEGRKRGDYSSCGDLPNALLFALGLRQSHYVNRAENKSYKVGWNVAKLTFLADALRNYARKPIGPADIAALKPGDITIVWNRPDTFDAHVAVVRGHGKLTTGAPALLTSDYGQGFPLDGKQQARRVDGIYIGQRKLQRAINLEEAVLLCQQTSPRALEGYFASAQPGRPTLRIGSRGQAVKELQRRLGSLLVDGRFGPLTHERVEWFQTGAGLQVDGVCGPLTWAALELVLS